MLFQALYDFGLEPRFTALGMSITTTLLTGLNSLSLTTPLFNYNLISIGQTVLKYLQNN